MPFSSLLDPGTYSVVTLAIVIVGLLFVFVFVFFLGGREVVVVVVVKTKEKNILKNYFNVPIFITKTIF